MDFFSFSSEKTNNLFDLHLAQQIQTVCLNMHESNQTQQIKLRSMLSETKSKQEIR